MDKIYSRFRIGRIRKERIIKLLKLIILIFLFFLFIRLVKGMVPLFNTLCENSGKSTATSILNKSTSEIMKKYTYDNIIDIEKDANENIKLVKINTIVVNEIISDITESIQNDIDSIEGSSVGIALGSFTGIKIFSGVGPKIRIKVSSVGNIKTNIESQFETQGINQTIHKIMLNFNCQIIVLTPFYNISSNVENQVLIAENIILGNIPEAYYDLNGLTQEDSMNFIEGR